MTGVAFSSLGQLGRERALDCNIGVVHFLGAALSYGVVGLAVDGRFGWQMQMVLQALAAVGYLRLVGGRIGWFEPGVFKQRWQWALKVWFAAIPGLFGVLRINDFLFDHVFEGEPGNSLVGDLWDMPIQELLWSLPIVLLLMPALEEMLFRGYLFRMLVAAPSSSATRRRFSLLGALFGSSLVFALAHGPGMWLPAFYLGLVLAWIDWRGGDLRLCFLVHSFHNTVFLAVA